MELLYFQSNDGVEAHLRFFFTTNGFEPNFWLRTKSTFLYFQQHGGFEPHFCTFF